MIVDNAVAQTFGEANPERAGRSVDDALPGARPAAPFVRIDNVSKRFAARRPWRELVKAPFNTSYVQALSGVSLSIE